MLLWNARRLTVARGEVVVAVLLNIGWVVGSAVLIVMGPLTILGNVGGGGGGHRRAGLPVGSRSSASAGSARPDGFAHPSAFAYHRPS